MFEDAHEARIGDVVFVDIASWVDHARADPQAYLERQATEVFLAAIGLTPSYGKRIYLKGGVLMGIRYGSPRQTADLDFTTSLDPSTAEIESIRAEFDQSLLQASAQLGHPDLICRVQTIKTRPRNSDLSLASFPALEIKVAYALRGSPGEARLNAGQCSVVLDADISFNEPVDALQIVRLGQKGPEIGTYSLLDLMAEKLRALLQQVSRNRYRRQDIFDLAYLIERLPLNKTEMENLLRVFKEKCVARGIDPNQDSISNPEVIRRARAEWETLAIEIGALPNFDERYNVVQSFYRSLPW